MNRMPSSSSNQAGRMVVEAIVGTTTMVPWAVEIVVQTTVVEAMTRATTRSSSSNSNKPLVSRCKATMTEEVR